MIRSLLAFSAIVIAAGFTAQDSFSPARTYAAGEKDLYDLSMRLSTGQYEVAILGKLSHEVKKVHENGEADIESKTYDITINVLGQEEKQPPSDPRTVRYTKFGVPMEKGVAKEKKQPIFMNFLTYRPSVEMKVGETVKIDETLESDGKTKVKGTSKLLSINEGVAKIESDLSVQEGNKKPTRVQCIGYFDAKTAKLNRSESKLTDVDPGDMPGMPPIQSITVVIERRSK